MDADTKKYVDTRNQNIINMIIEKAKNKYKDDIAIIALSGSLSKGDYHEKSDIDLVIINNTDRGWEICSGFIFDGIGYDIYCSPWDSRIEEEASLKCPRQASLLDMQVLYYASEADLERLKTYQERARKELEKPVNINSIIRANGYLDDAKKCLGAAYMSDSIGGVRYNAGGCIGSILNVISSVNNYYFKGGTKDFVKEAVVLPRTIDSLQTMVDTIIDSADSQIILGTLKDLTIAASSLIDNTYASLSDVEHDGLNGTYEELISNTYNKILRSCSINDKLYSFMAGVSAQDFLDEMHCFCGTPKYNVMEFFDSSNLEEFTQKYIEITRDYKKQCIDSGVTPKEYSSFEELYNDYMNN